jgi:hypothetical protein
VGHLALLRVRACGGQRVRCAALTLKLEEVVRTHNASVCNHYVDTLGRGRRYSSLEHGHLVVPVADITFDELSIAKRVSVGSLSTELGRRRKETYGEISAAVAFPFTSS